MASANRVIGRTTVVGIGRETTRGTAVTPGYWVGITSLDFDDKNDYADNDAGIGMIGELNDSVIVNTWSEGSFEGKVYDKSVGVELYCLFGQDTAAQIATSGAYTHTYALLNNNVHPSMTVAYKDTLQNVAFAQAMIDTWAIDVAVGKFITRKIGLKGQPSAVATNTAAFTIEPEFIPNNVILKLAANLAGLSGATASKVTAFSMEINKNVDTSFILGQSNPDDINNKQFNVSGTITAFLDDLTLHNLSLQGTLQAMSLDLLTTITVGTSGTNKAELLFTLPKVRFQNYQRKWGQNDLNQVTVDFDGMYSIADTAIMTAVLTNAVAAY